MGSTQTSTLQGWKKSSLNLSSSTEQHPSLKVFLKIYSPSWARGGRNTKMEREEGKAEKPESLGRGRKRRWTKKNFPEWENWGDWFSRPFFPTFLSPFGIFKQFERKGRGWSQMLLSRHYSLLSADTQYPVRFREKRRLFQEEEGH